MELVSNSTICKLCTKQVALLGLPNHVERIHNIKYKLYRDQYLIEFGRCEKCGSVVIKPRRFCSSVCAGSIGMSKVEKYNRRNRSSKNTHKSYVKQMDIELKKEVVSFYNDNVVTHDELMEKFKLPHGVIHLIMKEFSVKQKSRKEIAIHNFNKKLGNFSKTETCKNIISEYNTVGISLKFLSKKYNITKPTLKSILKYNNIKIKSAIDSKRDVILVKMSKGIRGGMFGKSPSEGAGRTKWYSYNGVNFQGPYELWYGMWLSDSKIDFIGHKNIRRFKYLKNNIEYTYCPDFYIPIWDKYIETKGFFRDDCKEKMSIIKQTYPDINIEILTKRELVEKGIFNYHKILGVEIEDYQIDLIKRNILSVALKKINRDILIKESITEQQNIPTLSKKYEIPSNIMSRIFNLLKIPRIGSHKYTTIRLDSLCDKIGKDISKDYTDGMGLKGISRKYKIKGHKIDYIFKKLKIKKRPNQLQRSIYRYNDLLTNEIGLSIKKDYENDTPLTVLVKRYKMAKITIKNILKNFNVSMKPEGYYAKKRHEYNRSIKRQGK